MSTDDAVRQGRTDPEDAAKVGIDCLPVSTELAGPQLAVRAAEKALAAAGWQADSIDLLLHAWIHHQGHDFWSPAHYIADSLGARRAFPLGLQQMCNGAAAGLEVATARLLADPATTRVLVTTGDRFDDAGFDRWQGDYGVWYGDGGTACLLERQSTDAAGGMLLLALSSRSIADVEALHRGSDEFSPASRWIGPVVDVRRTKKAFIEDRGLAGFYAGTHDALRGVVLDGLAEAGLEPDDPRIALIAIPRVGRTVVAETYEPALNGITKAEVRYLGERTGHLGAGDLLANLQQAASTGLVRENQVGLFVSAGGGFSFSCAVVEFSS